MICLKPELLRSLSCPVSYIAFRAEGRRGKKSEKTTPRWRCLFSSLIKLDEDGKPKSISAFSDAATKISNRVFSNANVQRALKKGVGEDVFHMFSQKMELFQEAGLCTYEPIPAEDTKKAMKLYTEASAEDCEPDT